MKNILLFFLSEMHLKQDYTYSHTIYTLADDTQLDCIQTNESAVKYMMYYLEKKREQINDIFFFSTNRDKEDIAVRNKTGFKIITHEECFRQRIIEAFPSLKDSIHAIDYDETQDAGNSIQQVAAMAGTIKEYIRLHAEEEVYLHADMTGGLRHASMMMLSVIQLLRFSGIHVGRVMYSDFQQKKIVDVTEVHRMFTLVSGADEFVNYGSVAAIEEYFREIPQDNQSPELQELLRAMRNFSDAIKICKIDAIEQELKVLNRKIKNFRDCDEKYLQEKLFAEIIDTIQQEYGNLITGRTSRLDIIKWCAKKGFLQQAMTMCTEWIPIIIVDTQICYPKDNALLMQPQGKKNYRCWQYNFIRELQWNTMFSDKIVASKYKQFYVIRVLRQYETIREERNHINHVNECGVKTLQDIKDMIINCVTWIENRDTYRKQIPEK